MIEVHILILAHCFLPHPSVTNSSPFPIARFLTGLSEVSTKHLLSNHKSNLKIQQVITPNHQSPIFKSHKNTSHQASPIIDRSQAQEMRGSFFDKPVAQCIVSLSKLIIRLLYVFAIISHKANSCSLTDPNNGSYRLWRNVADSKRIARVMAMISQSRLHKFHKNTHLDVYFSFDGHDPPLDSSWFIAHLQPQKKTPLQEKTIHTTIGKRLSYQCLSMKDQDSGC